MTQRTTAPSRVAIAANNGEIGGGEVMLLNIARACEELGIDVTVVGPSHPSELVDAARRAGHRTVALEAHGRREWMRSLRRWDRTQRDGILWCNGFVPALATAGRPNRIVHLHSIVGATRRALLAIARAGALATLVPSIWMQRSVRGSRVFPNWVEPVPSRGPAERDGDEFVVGFLGRISVDKGVPVLARAIQELEQQHPGRFRLLLAGAPRFVSEHDEHAVQESLAPIETLIDRTGWVEPSEFFSRVDLLVCPSVAPESFGLVAAEAMSARSPLVVTDAGALPEVLGRDSADVVPAGDSDALVRAIIGHADGAADRSSTTQKAYERWSTEFSPDSGRARTKRMLAQVGLVR